MMIKVNGTAHTALVNSVMRDRFQIPYAASSGDAANENQNAIAKINPMSIAR